MPASDEMRNTSAAASQVRQADTPTGQAMASSTPSVVATPLPPRNLSHTGNRWPTTAPTAAVTAMSVP